MTAPRKPFKERYITGAEHKRIAMELQAKAEEYRTAALKCEMAYEKAAVRLVALGALAGACVGAVIAGAMR